MDEKSFSTELTRHGTQLEQYAQNKVTFVSLEDAATVPTSMTIKPANRNFPATRTLENKSKSNRTSINHDLKVYNDESDKLKLSNVNLYGNNEELK